MFQFRPLRREDFEKVAVWSQAPHARAWYGEDLAEIIASYTPDLDRERAFMASLDGRDIALLERFRLGDHPVVQQAYAVTDPEMTNIDVIIGEPDAAHRGLGPSLIRQFLREKVFCHPKVPGCVIDPEADNAIAIRAYEKAGFRFARAMADDAEGNSVYLLEMMRDELDAPAPAPPIFLRPARPSEIAMARAIDDDACTAYAEVGIHVDFPDDHPFALDEIGRWAEAASLGRLLFACTREESSPIGFVAYGLVDERPFIHQISVRRAFMRQGVGTALIERVKRWAVRPGEIFLTTYDHVPFNRPWYERLGFIPFETASTGPELRAIFDRERANVGDPDRRLVMRWARTT